MKPVFIASVGIAALLGVGHAQATSGIVNATHAGVFCYEFRLAGSPNWYAIPMIGIGYPLQAAEISVARDTLSRQSRGIAFKAAPQRVCAWILAFFSDRFR